MTEIINEKYITFRDLEKSFNSNRKLAGLITANLTPITLENVKGGNGRILQVYLVDKVHDEIVKHYHNKALERNSKLLEKTMARFLKAKKFNI